MTPQKSLNRAAWADLILLSLIWGGSFLSMRIALDEIGVLTVVAHRVGWAAVILWLYVVLRRLPVPRSLRVWGAFLVMGFLNNVIPFSLIAWGQLTIETGLASILNATTAIFGFSDRGCRIQRRAFDSAASHRNFTGICRSGDGNRLQVAAGV